MPTQRENRELVDLMGTHFYRRNEPNVAWFNAISAMKMLLGMRGLWPMSVFDSSGNAQDVSGHGHHLTYSGNPGYGIENLIPYINMDGTGDYLTRLDEADLDITGSESYVETAYQGLTLGGWFYVPSLSANQNIITKWDNPSNRSYALTLHNATGELRWEISTNGTDNPTARAATTAWPLTEWFYAAARFDPSTELKLWVDLDTYTDVTSIPATIHSGSGNFHIGAVDNTPSAYFVGKMSLCFLCAAFLPDYVVESIFEHTRSMFGK